MSADETLDQRRRMVDFQIRGRGLRDERLLSVFEHVPRHLFVPQGLRHAAYDDTPLPIGDDQTISQPYIVALMVDLLELNGSERVLEIGTGSGYEAAILGGMAARVETIEIVPNLAIIAQHLLKDLGYSNVHVHIGDGTLGWSEAAPYQAIVTAAAAPGIPEPLLEQLADGGRLVLPVEEGHQQYLKKITRHGNDYDEHVVAAVAFVPLLGKYGWG
jgi:protein-L-isoaspartate(D-aspartate) O-methyltransferase